MSLINLYPHRRLCQKFDLRFHFHKEWNIHHEFPFHTKSSPLCRFSCAISECKKMYKHAVYESALQYNELFANSVDIIILTCASGNIIVVIIIFIIILCHDNNYYYFYAYYIAVHPSSDPLFIAW